MLSKELIKLMRILVGYSQEDLSRVIKVDRSYISKVEHGRLAPTMIVQLSIIQACKRAGMSDIQFALLKVLTEEGTEKEGVSND